MIFATNQEKQTCNTKTKNESEDCTARTCFIENKYLNENTERIKVSTGILIRTLDPEEASNKNADEHIHREVRCIP